jgi:hypothetical protein
MASPVEAHRAVVLLGQPAQAEQHLPGQHLPQHHPFQDGAAVVARLHARDLGAGQPVGRLQVRRRAFRVVGEPVDEHRLEHRGELVPGGGVLPDPAPPAAPDHVVGGLPGQSAVGPGGWSSGPTASQAAPNISCNERSVSSTASTTVRSRSGTVRGQ